MNEFNFLEFMGAIFIMVIFFAVLIFFPNKNKTYDPYESERIERTDKAYLKRKKKKK